MKIIFTSHHLMQKKNKMQNDFKLIMEEEAKLSNKVSNEMHKSVVEIILKS
jgi:hypothetical protein